MSANFNAVFFATEVNFSIDPSLPLPQKACHIGSKDILFLKYKIYLLKYSIHTEEDTHHKYMP